MENQPCIVYRSGRKADTYLYVERRDDFERVPAALLEQLGELAEVVEVELTPERRLARADATTVIRALRDEGFYLQLPPQDELRLSG